MGRGVSERPESTDPIATEHHFYHDMQGHGSLSTTIVSALAELNEVDVASLGGALYDYIDTDALDAIFSPKLDGTTREGCRIECTFRDQSITIHSNGHIVITDSPQPLPR